MISMHDWKYLDINVLDNLEVSYAITYAAKKLDIDERTEWVKSYVSGVSESVTSVSFINNELQIGDASHPIRDLNKINMPVDRVLIDATSLSFPELLYLFYLAKLNHTCFDVLYVEPAEYSEEEDDEENKENEPKGLTTTKFKLSEDGPGINMLPMFLYPTVDMPIVIGLGFEGHRFGALLNSEEYEKSKFQCLVGAPPFYTGWEKVSYDNNYVQMEHCDTLKKGEYNFAAANDPYSNYKLLEEIYSAERFANRMSQKATEHDFYINLAPFGTKPVATAMAWFAVNYDNVGILYDFIEKVPKRTKGCGRVHVWSYEHT